LSQSAVPPALPWAVGKAVKWGAVIAAGATVLDGGTLSPSYSISRVILMCTIAP